MKNMNQNIVIADSNLAIQHTYTSMFKNQKVHVEFAKNRKQLLELTCEKTPQLIITEINLPEEGETIFNNNENLTKVLKSCNPETPIIITTGKKITWKDRLYYDHFLKKPFTKEDLFYIINTHNFKLECNHISEQKIRTYNTTSILQKQIENNSLLVHLYMCAKYDIKPHTQFCPKQIHQLKKEPINKATRIITQWSEDLVEELVRDYYFCTLNYEIESQKTKIITGKN
jgi:DNA-binding NtrC family response regulator